MIDGLIGSSNDDDPELSQSVVYVKSRSNYSLYSRPTGLASSDPLSPCYDSDN